MAETQTPVQQARQLAEEAESRTAKAMEEVVSRDSFGEVLALVAGNAITLMRLGSDAADLVVRNLRLAGRRDVVSLHRQLARTEDKLERVLQEVERLQEQFTEAERSSGSNGTTRRRTSKPAARK
jgi:hypothetical protein